MAIYKHGRGFELGTTKNKSGKCPEWDLNQGLLDCKSNALTMRNTTSLRVVDSRAGPFREWAFISNYAIKNSRANKNFCQRVLHMTNESYADG